MTNRVATFFERIGHGAKIAGKDAAKVAIPVGEVALPIAFDFFPEAKALPAIVSAVAGVRFHESVATTFIKTEGYEPMNPLETFAITIVLGTLQTVIKNPAHKAALESQLVGVATDILQAYGIQVPSAAVPAAGTVVSH